MLKIQEMFLLSPWTPPLSRKLLKLNDELLEAKYWTNLCGANRKIWFKLLITMIFASIIHLISISQQMMCGYESFVDDDPIGVLWSLHQQISQMRNGNIWFICAMY